MVVAVVMMRVAHAVTMTPVTMAVHVPMVMMHHWLGFGDGRSGGEADGERGGGKQGLEHRKFPFDKTITAEMRWSRHNRTIRLNAA